MSTRTQPVIPDNLDPSRIAEIDVACRLAREIVLELGMPDVSDIGKSDPDPGGTIYKVDDGDLTLIHASIPSAYSWLSFQFSLTAIVDDVHRLTKIVLSDEDAPSVLHRRVMRELQKRGITMLRLFDLDPVDVDRVATAHAKDVTKLFLSNLTAFTSSALVDTLGHTKIAYIQYVLEPMMKEHWTQLGLPEAFGLVEQEQIDSLWRYDLNRRKGLLGDPRQFLSLSRLADEADRLRLQYKGAKSAYRGLSQRRRETRVERLKLEFPLLRHTALEQIESLTPAELACLHLADIYRYTRQTMQKKIAESRRLRRPPNSLESA